MNDKPGPKRKSGERDYSADAVPAADRIPDARRPAAEASRSCSRAGQKLDLYERLREAAQGPRRNSSCTTARPTPTATSISAHALNKILKDVVTRSQQMLGYDSNYVPGWDCHGLPIEWKIEEENYRAKGKNKPTADRRDRSSSASECRAFAEHWLDVQREEFKRLGVEGDWEHPYTTMSFRGRGADRARADEVRRATARSIAARSR